MTILMLVVAISVSAQTVIYSVAKTQVTLDATWEDMAVESASDKHILVIFDMEKEQIKVTNKDESMFFITHSEELDDIIDEEGDIMKSMYFTCWDEEGNSCNIGFKWWDNEDITFSDDIETIMSVYNENYWVRYYLMIESYRE